MRLASLNTIIGLLCFFLIFHAGAQQFQGKAEYVYKAKMELGRWGDNMSQEQKKQIAERLKNRLDKTYILTFNKEESIYKEYEKLDAMSGATDSWGKNFTPGHQYKNVKTNAFIQSQELYGKRFLIKDELLEINWMMQSETKQIGDYTCFKAVTRIPSTLVSFWEFDWGKLRQTNNEEDKGNGNAIAESDAPKVEEISMTEIVAWYAPQIPISQGPSEFWGLPGLILELTIGNTTMLCSKIVINPKNKTLIEAPDKGAVVTKMEYQDIVVKKMQEFRSSYSGRRRS